MGLSTLFSFLSFDISNLQSYPQAKKPPSKENETKKEEIHLILWYNWIATKQHTKQKWTNPSVNDYISETYKMNREIINFSKKFGSMKNLVWFVYEPANGAFAAQVLV